MRPRRKVPLLPADAKSITSTGPLVITTPSTVAASCRLFPAKKSVRSPTVKEKELQQKFNELELGTTDMSLHNLLAFSENIIKKSDKTHQMVAKVTAAREILVYLLKSYKMPLIYFLCELRCKPVPWVMRELIACFDNMTQAALNDAVRKLNLKKIEKIIVLEEDFYKKYKDKRNAEQKTEVDTATEPLSATFILAEKKQVIFMVLDALHLFVCESSFIPDSRALVGEKVLSYLIHYKEEASICDEKAATLVPVPGKLKELAEDEDLGVPEWCQNIIMLHETGLGRRYSI